MKDIMTDANSNVWNRYCPVKNNDFELLKQQHNSILCLKDIVMLNGKFRLWNEHVPVHVSTTTTFEGGYLKEDVVLQYI